MNALKSSLRTLASRSSSALILAAAIASITSGCALSAVNEGPAGSTSGSGGSSVDSSTATSNSGVGGGAGGEMGVGSSGTGTGSGTGAGPNDTPYFNGSYSYLCGGSSPVCVPGTEDCTPGGPSGMGNSGAGGNMIACQLVAEASKAVAACASVGEFAAGDPCESAAHCGAGLGCVATPSGGVCRAYCCDEVEDCAADTYCAPLAMAESAVKVPVCIPVKKCQPLDDTTCDNGQTCTIVRDDGTTSCVDPGPGLRSEGCPCAPGFVCSKINNTCLQLCQLGNDADCMGGTCQGGVMGYPEGIGICVGFD